MPHPSARRAARRSGGERVFSDDDGRLWSASFTREGNGAGAVVFSCISDSRQPVRAIAMDGAHRLKDAADDTLRTWLRDAPRIGRLT
jgi:hypothetical protein